MWEVKAITYPETKKSYWLFREGLTNSVNFDAANCKVWDVLNIFKVSTIDNKLVFFRLRVSLLHLNHRAALSSSLEVSDRSEWMSGPSDWMEQSSAKSWLKMKRARGKSLMKIKNSIGPNTVPWGIPQSMTIISERVLPDKTCCVLFK